MAKAVRGVVEEKLCGVVFPFKDFLVPLLAPLIKTFHGESRSRIYPPENVVFIMVSSVLSRDDSLSSAVIRNNTHRLSEGLDPASLNTASFSNARQKLSVEVLIQATKQGAANTDREIIRKGEDKFWGNFNPYTIDGSTLTANDTPENQGAFPQHGMQKEGVGFPILRIVMIQSLTSGMVCTAAYDAFSGKETGEMALARKLYPDLGENALLIGDRYFPSYFTMAELLKNNAQGVFQAHAARDCDFRRGLQIGSCDHIVEWIKPQRPSWMSREDYDCYQDSILMRETDISKNMGGNERFVIVTTLLDVKTFPKEKIAEFYSRRWNIELAYRDLKETFDMGHISANTPEMVEKIIWSKLLSYNTLRWHMLNAAVLYETTIDKISVKTTATVMTQNSTLLLTTPPAKLPKLFASLYFQIVQVPVGNRPGRSEPRAVKKRPKPFPRLNMKRSDWHAKKTP